MNFLPYSGIHAFQPRWEKPWSQGSRFCRTIYHINLCWSNPYSAYSPTQKNSFFKTSLPASPKEFGFGDCHPIFFSSRNYGVLGDYWLKIFFFQSWESWYSTVSNTHTWEWKVDWAETVLKTNLNSKVPVYPTSRNHLKCSHEKHFSSGHKRSLLAGCAENKYLFLRDYIYSISSLFWIYQSWHLEYIRAARIWKSSASTELSKICHWKLVSTG